MTQTLLQLTDIHLLESANESMGPINTDQTLQAVLAQVKQDPEYQQLNAVLLTGDLAHAGKTTAYQRLVDYMKPIQAPVYWLPGNHDVLSTMQAAFHGHFREEHNFQQGAWRVVMLNSLWPEHVEGLLSEFELQKLEKALVDHPDQPTLIAVHHHLQDPCPIDKVANLTNADQLIAIVKQHPQVKMVINGHVHAEREQYVEGICSISTPSTCFQFKIDNNSVSIDEVTPPGYRWFLLHDDGSFETRVGHVEH